MIRSGLRTVFIAALISCVAAAAQANPPKIKSFTPTAGPPGQEVRIRGAGFGSDPSVVQVRLGGVPVQVVSVKNNEIRVRVTPKNPSGVFQLAVSGTRSNPTPNVFEVLPPLKATKMEPEEVAHGGEVRIVGSGFSTTPRDHKLVIGRISVTADRIESNAVVFKIPSKVPEGANTVRLEVKNRGVINIPVALNVSAALSVRNFSPQSGEPGSTLTIRGQGFGTSPSAVRVKMGKAFATVQSVTPTELTVTVPSIAAPTQVTIQTKVGGSVISKQTFTPKIDVAITGFAPTAGQPKQLVRLYGQGFSTNPRKNHVTIDGKTAAVTEAAANTMVVRIPNGVSSDNFSIRVDGGGSGKSDGVFQIAEPISIVSISPEQGSVGAYVRIKGKGFSTQGMRAYVGRKPAGMRVYSETQALIGIPAGAKDGPIMLVSPEGARAVSKKYFKVIPSITVNKFYPLSGRPGTKVTLYGDQFAPGKTKVYLGKAELKVEPGMSKTMMVVNVPETAQSGPFRIAVQGRRQVRSIRAFKVIPPVASYTPKPQTPKESSVLEVTPDDKPVVETLLNEPPPPAEKKGAPEKAPSIDELLGFESADGDTVGITGLDPAEGVVGDTVMINGSSFGDDPTKVTAWIGTKKAEVVGCVPDMIMIEVPAGATTGKVKIKIGGKPTLTSKVNFTVK